MVLKARNADVPAFESEDQAAPADAPAVEQTTAVAPARTTAVAKPLKATAAYGDFEDALPGVDFGTFPRITTDLGGFEMDKEVIGETIKLELMSWSHRYVVTPGVDDKEANELVRYSNDGEYLSDGSGTTVQEYLAKLQDVMGYDKASVKTYIDLTGILLAKGAEEIPAESQSIVQVQLSPQSVKQFNGYRITKGVMEARSGIATGNVLTMKRERNEYNGKKFAYISFK